MSTILEYPCGCRYYSDRTTTEPTHLCESHKLQAYQDALKEFVQDKKTKSTNSQPRREE